MVRLARRVPAEGLRPLSRPQARSLVACVSVSRRNLSECKGTFESCTPLLHPSSRFSPLRGDFACKNVTGQPCDYSVEPRDIAATQREGHAAPLPSCSRHAAHENALESCCNKRSALLIQPTDRQSRKRHSEFHHLSPPSCPSSSSFSASFSPLCNAFSVPIRGALCEDILVSPGELGLSRGLRWDGQRGLSGCPPAALPLSRRTLSSHAVLQRRGAEANTDSDEGHRETHPSAWSPAVCFPGSSSESTGSSASHAPHEGRESPPTFSHAESHKVEIEQDCTCSFCKPVATGSPPSPPDSLPPWLSAYASSSTFLSGAESSSLSSDTSLLPPSRFPSPAVHPSSAVSSTGAPLRRGAPAPAALLSVCEKRTRAGCRSWTFWSAVSACIRAHLPPLPHAENEAFFQDLYLNQDVPPILSLPSSPAPLSSSNCLSHFHLLPAPSSVLPRQVSFPLSLSPHASPFQAPQWSMQRFDLRTALRLFCLLGNQTPPSVSHSPPFSSSSSSSAVAPVSSSACSRSSPLPLPPSVASAASPSASSATAAASTFSCEKQEKTTQLPSDLHSGEARASRDPYCDKRSEDNGPCAADSTQTEARRRMHEATLHFVAAHILMRYQLASTLASRSKSGCDRHNDRLPALSVHELRHLVQVYVHLASQTDCRVTASWVAFLLLARHTVYTVVRSALSPVAPSSSSLSSCASLLSASLSPQLSLHSNPVLRNPSAGPSLSQLVLLLAAFSPPSDSPSWSCSSSSPSGCASLSSSVSLALERPSRDFYRPRSAPSLVPPWARLPPPADFLLLLQVKLTQQGGASLSAAELVQAAFLLAPHASILGGGRDSQGVLTFKAIGDELEYRIEELCGGVSSSALSGSAGLPPAAFSLEHLGKMEAGPELAIRAVQAFADADVCHEPFFSSLCLFLLSPCSSASSSVSSRSSSSCAARASATARAAEDEKREASHGGRETEESEDSEKEENTVVWLDTWRTGQIADLLFQFRRLRFYHDDLLDYLWTSYDAEALTPAALRQRDWEKKRKRNAAGTSRRRPIRRTTVHLQSQSLSSAQKPSAQRTPSTRPRSMSPSVSLLPQVSPSPFTTSTSSSSSSSAFDSPTLEDTPPPGLCPAGADGSPFQVAEAKERKKIRFYDKCTPHQLLTFLHMAGHSEVPPPSPQWQTQVAQLLVSSAVASRPTVSGSSSLGPASSLSLLATLSRLLSPVETGDLGTSLLRLTPLAGAEALAALCGGFPRRQGDLSSADKAEATSPSTGLDGIGSVAPERGARKTEKAQVNLEPQRGHRTRYAAAETDHSAGRLEREEREKKEETRNFLKAMPLSQLPSFSLAVLLHSPPLSFLSGRTRRTTLDCADHNLSSACAPRWSPCSSSLPLSLCQGSSPSSSRSTESSAPAASEENVGRDLGFLHRAPAGRRWPRETEETVLLSWAVLLERMLRLWRRTAAPSLHPLLNYALLHHQLSSDCRDTQWQSSQASDSSSAASKDWVSASRRNVSTSELHRWPPSSTSSLSSSPSPSSSLDWSEMPSVASPVSSSFLTRLSSAPHLSLLRSLLLFEQKSSPSPSSSSSSPSSSSSCSPSCSPSSSSCSPSPPSSSSCSPFSSPSSSLQKYLVSPLVQGVPSQLPLRLEPRWASADPAVEASVSRGVDWARCERAGDEDGDPVRRESSSWSPALWSEFADRENAATIRSQEADIADVRLSTAARLCRQTLLSLLVYVHLSAAPLSASSCELPRVSAKSRRHLGSYVVPGSLSSRLPASRTPTDASSGLPSSSFSSSSCSAFAASAGQNVVASALSSLSLDDVRKVYLLTVLATSGLLWRDTGGGFGTKRLNAPVDRFKEESAPSIGRPKTLDEERARGSVLNLQALLQQTLLVHPDEEGRLRQRLRSEGDSKRVTREDAVFLQALKEASPLLREEWREKERRQTQERQRQEEARDTRVKEKLTRRDQMRLWEKLQRPRACRTTAIKDAREERVDSEEGGERDGNGRNARAQCCGRNIGEAETALGQTRAQAGGLREAGEEVQEPLSSLVGTEKAVDDTAFAGEEARGVCFTKFEEREETGEPGNLYRRFALAEEAATALLSHHQGPFGDSTPRVSGFHRQVLSALQPALQLLESTWKEAERERDCQRGGHNGGSPTDDADENREQERLPRSRQRPAVLSSARGDSPEDAHQARARVTEERGKTKSRGEEGREGRKRREADKREDRGNKEGRHEGLASRKGRDTCWIAQETPAGPYVLDILVLQRR
ncbi:hypothetical protein TGP89_277490 [Toxoplasma gondii p89]|uniref:Uncharacterized protein n=1 Tax=Toxoplasma gondii p89 TaxID=943119 RepID=A0A086JJU2_TOXGO|nr:hypothetical protein TGP89_277490 [Toxoplasma gondii p89]